MPRFVETDRESEFVDVSGITMLSAEESTRKDGTWVALAHYGTRSSVLRRGTADDCRGLVARLAVAMNRVEADQ